MKARRIKKVISIVLVLAMCLGALPVAGAADGGVFVAVNSYQVGTFTDVNVVDWFYEYVKSAYELGLMVGNDDGTFAPADGITVAEAVTIAARLHSVYHTGADNFEQASPWYQVYVDYAAENGFADVSGLDMNAAATRGQFAEIIASALPTEALVVTNEIVDDEISDVKISDSYGPAVYQLYRAGILTGDNSAGAFLPAKDIQRSEVAAIISRAVAVLNGTPESLSAGTFELHANFYDYGNVIDSVLIKLPGTVKAESIGITTFNVHAVVTNIAGDTIFDGTRIITDAYACDESGVPQDEGSYVTLELMHGYQSASTEYGISGSVVNGSSIARASVGSYTYTVTQLGNINAVDGLIPRNTHYEWTNTVTENNYYTDHTKTVQLGEEYADTALGGVDLNLVYRSFEPADGGKHPLIVYAYYQDYDAYEETAFVQPENQEIFGGAYVLDISCPSELVSLAVGWDYRPVYKAYASLILDLIDSYIAENPNIDTSKIYMGGYSFSSGTTLECMLQAEDRFFAATFPMSGGFELTEEEVEALKNENMWLITCEGDMGYAGNVAVYDALTAAGSTSVKQTINRYVFGDDGTQYNAHWNWVMALNNDIVDENGVSLFEWLASMDNK